MLTSDGFLHFSLDHVREEVDRLAHTIPNSSRFDSLFLSLIGCIGIEDTGVIILRLLPTLSRFVGGFVSSVRDSYPLRTQPGYLSSKPTHQFIGRHIGDCTNPRHK